MCLFEAGRLIPRVLERRREREEREPRDEDNPDEPVLDETDEVEDSGNRNVDLGLPSPRNVARTLSRSTVNEEDNSSEAQENLSNEEAREGEEE